MKRIIIFMAAVICSIMAMAQDISQFKVFSDSLFLSNEAYVKGNRYQRDAMLFVDMLVDTHPYYIKKEHRDEPTFADVDKEYSRAVVMGAKPIMEPTTEPWGQRTCYVADPEGNLIEICSFNEE